MAKTEYKKIALIYNTARYLIKFRSELIKEFQALGYSIIAIVPNDGRMAQLEEMGVHYIELEMSAHGRNPLREMRTFLALFRVLRKERPDITINFTIKPVIYGSIAAALAGVRETYSIITGLGYVFVDGGLRRRLLRNLATPAYWLALRLNRKVFFQNPDDQSLLVGRRLISPTRAVVTNGSGVNIDVFQPEPPTSQDTIFLCVGRMLRDKGLVEFVRAAELTQHDWPEAKFWLLGAIEQGPAAISMSQLQKLTKPGVIRYLDEVDDVRPILKQATVFVLPSYREGAPRSVLEAMAMGKPIITTDVPGCRETVVDGENGYLVPVHGVDALSVAMLRFRNAPDLIERMGKRSREIVVERYDVKKVNAQLIRAMQITQG